jgi:hypothetical protein
MSLYLPVWNSHFTAGTGWLSMPDDAPCAGILSRCLAQDAELGRAVG